MRTATAIARTLGVPLARVCCSGRKRLFQSCSAGSIPATRSVTRRPRSCRCVPNNSKAVPRERQDTRRRALPRRSEKAEHEPQSKQEQESEPVEALAGARWGSDRAGRSLRGLLVDHEPQTTSAAHECHDSRLEIDGAGRLARAGPRLREGQRSTVVRDALQDDLANERCL